MHHRRGLIIAVIGAPRSGKSFLVRKLAKHYRAHYFLEGEESDLPARIKEDIAKNLRPLERILWFHNGLVKKYLHALALKKKGKTVVLDSFWLSNHMFIDTLLKGFERKIVRDLAALDRKMLGWPDVTVYLKISEEGMRKFIAKGRRTFDRSEEFIRDQALPVARIYERFFSKAHVARRVLTIRRDKLDFSRRRDFKRLVEKIERFVNR